MKSGLEIISHPIFKTIGQAADNLNVECYVIGGFVRDQLLNRDCKDIDVVCVGSGIDLAIETARLCNLPEQAVNVFKNFGTAMFRFDEDWELEFVGARKESYDFNSRKPTVEEGSLEDDQNRRDFTINALAVGLNSDNWGKLIDPFEGLKDLESKTIKTPLEPSITFSDDPLRMMRAVRFATQLGFDIESETFEALQNEKERLSIISFERISDELNKIITSNKPSYGFLLLDACGILPIIFPEFVKLKGVDTEEGKGHKDNFYHTLQVLDNITKSTNDLWWRWAAILHDIAKPDTKRFDKKKGWTFHGHEDLGARQVPGIFKRLKLPLNEKMKLVQKLVRLHLRPIALAKEEISDAALRRLLFEAGDDLEALMALCRADITSKNGEKVKRYLKNFDIVEQKLKEVEEKDQIRNFQPVITGEIIMETFDIGPSKEIGIIKIAIREAILEGIIPNDLEKSWDFMLAEGAKLGLYPKGNC
ncbi:HD domain-containing protein [Sandaracinomonas limnophila]|uniref:HD domain-containing protein n=1 Tax=Sandaracinomonas limnophila TaxID=1862386 RepID=A0A437PW16_9BACT|nr:HD domain-containing protein [Sandaracinomonas limnophila]RVU26447.1 HD domain-containing protein [Sandaracinomonas limnophila]